MLKRASQIDTESKSIEQIHAEFMATPIVPWVKRNFCLETRPLTPKECLDIAKDAQKACGDPKMEREAIHLGNNLFCRYEHRVHIPAQKNAVHNTALWAVKVKVENSDINDFEWGEVGCSFRAMGTQITNLDFFPTSIQGDLDCTNNRNLKPEQIEQYIRQTPIKGRAVCYHPIPVQEKCPTIRFIDKGTEISLDRCLVEQIERIVHYGEEWDNFTRGDIKRLINSIPVYLVKADDLPVLDNAIDYSKDRIDLLGCYVHYEREGVSLPYIMVSPDKIWNLVGLDKAKFEAVFTLVVLHEFAHAMIAANGGCSANEEAMANAVALSYIHHSVDRIAAVGCCNLNVLLSHSRSFVSDQPKAYCDGLTLFDERRLFWWE